MVFMNLVREVIDGFFQGYFSETIISSSSTVPKELSECLKKNGASTTKSLRISYQIHVIRPCIDLTKE